MLLVELMRGLVEEGLVRVVSGTRRACRGCVPRRLCNIVRAELARVSPIARQSPRSRRSRREAISFDHVAAMLDVSPASLLGPVEELVHGKTWSCTPDASLAFQSELLRVER